MSRVQYGPALLVCQALIVAGCAARMPPNATRPVAAPSQVEGRTTVLDLVEGLPQKASGEALRWALPAILTAAYRARGPAVGAVRRGLVVLREQPNVVGALESTYAQLPASDRDGRRFLVAVLGELRRADGLPLLVRVAWAELPPPTPAEGGLSPREIEESAQAKAVQGMAYLRSDEGDQAVLRVIDSHPSSFVRAAAIEAYLWNHGDTERVRDEIRNRVRVGDRKYVGLARFSRKMKADVFNRQLLQSRGPHE